MAAERDSSGREVLLISGAPASGKSGLAETFVQRGYERLNRDIVGGKVDDLLPMLSGLLDAGREGSLGRSDSLDSRRSPLGSTRALGRSDLLGRSVVLDNLYPTVASRAGVIAIARAQKVPIRCLLMDTGIEDAQFNACMRMVERTGRVLHPDDHKDPRYKSDPNLFPIVVMYKYRKDFEEPTTAEGFDKVERVKFERRYPAEWVNKAMIFDFDGTLRTTTGKEKYPVHPSEVRAFVHRADKLKALAAEGTLLLGASNQSGIAKRKLTAADAEACFAETLRQLGVSFQEVRYCPHSIPPLSCYCRKPGPGMGVELIAKYKLDPRQCIYVGDMTTDRSFAARCGFQFVDHDTFFA